MIHTEHVKVADTLVRSWALHLATVSGEIVFTDTIRAVISLVLLGACLFVILSSRYREKERNWAFSTIGALTGFWLRSMS
jgi:hypothetical protein